MSNQGPKTGQITQGIRHPLLLQVRLNEQNFWTSMLILAVSIGLLVWDPDTLDTQHPLLILLAVGSGLILVATFALRLAAYVQCRDNGLLLHVPFYNTTIPYREISKVRPTELYRMFPPGEQRWTQRRFLKPLFGRTVLVVEVERLPHNKRWLQLWMSKYMLCPDAVGWVIPVRDWMAFRAELDAYQLRFR